MDEDCDVCKIEFPHAKPNKAVEDKCLPQLGCWAFVCEGHGGKKPKKEKSTKKKEKTGA